MLLDSAEVRRGQTETTLAVFRPDHLNKQSPSREAPPVVQGSSASSLVFGLSRI
jgi:hypothetical protein